MVNDDSHEDNEPRIGPPDTQQDSDETDSLSGSNTEPTDATDPGATATCLSKTDWEELDSNPDFEVDFGYQVTDWEAFETADSSDQVMFLPTAESLVKEDAFIVAESGTLRDLGECC